MIHSANRSAKQTPEGGRVLSTPLRLVLNSFASHMLRINHPTVLGLGHKLAFGLHGNICFSDLPSHKGTP